MKSNAKTVLDAALALPSKKRAEIAERLISSLDGPEPSAAEQAEIDAAWAKEIERRMQEIENGTAKLIPYEQVMKDIQQMLNRKSKRKKKA